MFEQQESRFEEVKQSQPERVAESEPVHAPAEEVVPDGQAHQDEGQRPVPVEAEGVAEGSEVNGTAEGGWRAEAGRKGAQRIHQLIEHGKLYEQEHGLKSGRQRLRQLIEEGKLYEQEHGLSPVRRRPRSRRGARLSSEQRLANFLQALLPLVKPRFRGRVGCLLEGLQGEQN
jgi:hypothetical protein